MTEPVALVTGAARRVGAEIIQTLHRAGYRVILHYRQSAQEAEALVSRLNHIRRHSAVALRADLNDSAARQKLAADALAQWKRLDLLVNNASSFYPTPLGRATEAQWDDLLASNLKAPFFLAQALADNLRLHRGCIINITDIHGERPLAGHGIYSIAKAGNRMLTKTLALELAPDVRVNGIAPGAILWPEDPHGQEQETPEALGRVPLQSLGGAASIARAVLFLTQSDNYVTGHILTVDGGRTLLQ